jgi:hypothetical protein
MAGVTQLSWSAGSLSARVVPSSALYPLAGRRRAVGH